MTLEELFEAELDGDIRDAQSKEQNNAIIAMAFYIQSLRHQSAQTRALQWIASEGIETRQRRE